MKKSSFILLFFTFCFFLSAQQKPVGKTPTNPVEKNQEMPSGKFTGMIFNDFMYVVTEPLPSNPTTAVSGRFASLLRRATIGYEYSYNANVTARIVYDGSSNVLRQGFVDVRNIVSMLDLKVGLSQTIASETVDKIWKYRSLDASVLDRKAMTQEFDMGLTVTGRTDAQGTSYARLAVYNGTGTAPENDKLKKLALSVGNWFDKNSLLEVYVDYENVGNGKSSITGKAFFGMNAADYGVGGEGFYRMNRKFALTKDVVPAGASLFGWFEMMKALRGVLRVDVLDQDLNSDLNVYREIYLNAGVDYSPVPDVHLIPNVVYGKYMKKGTSPEYKDNIIARLTTAVYFK